MSTSGNPRSNALLTLQRFTRKPVEKAELCELCAAPLVAEHQHLLALDRRRVVCACDPCAILFDGNSRQRFSRIPRDVYRLENFEMEDHEWESLLIPIKLAYFIHNSSLGRIVAQYPSPGGAMESALDLEYWSAIAERNPVLQKFAPDVEALLVNRIAAQPHYYRVPVDHCFRLVGIIRTRWHGLSGGSEVWEAIDDFFRDLDLRAGGYFA